MKSYGGKVLFLDRSDINTDEIIPAKYLTEISKEALKPHMLEDLKLEGFVPQDRTVSEAKVIVTRSNFGCGSSREHAPVALNIAGIEAVVAESYARIFYRNAIDGGFLAPFETGKHLYQEIKTGDEVSLDTTKGILTNSTRQTVYQLNPLGEIEGILRAGGIFSYARKTGMLKE